ncbi:glycosyltransferase family 1 protein [Spirosoma pollinicola]|uniref:Glycosyl transferase n=1 Tax=Spirosoma pollinicola TaxID=2057025 RepID=A0A2K8YXY3_9BACT|nr:glycosyltransferase family 1 protein [Spirosoma pollinicola]AUD02496.1 glycosyl transferase [Spirosoma pollinicola]
MITDNKTDSSNKIRKSTFNPLTHSVDSINHPSSQLRGDSQDVICFTHLRWNFVYQRPQHLLSRASRQYRVWYVEEPVWQDTLGLDVQVLSDTIRVVVPRLPHGIDHETTIRLQRQLVNQLIEQQSIKKYVSWYYTPMALQFTDHLCPQLTVYDCMDELSAFKGASPQLLDLEKRLLAKANLVFTGGYSLYEAKRSRHEHVFAFPSCIDYQHFEAARQKLPDPVDQRHLTGLRIGYSGVIDERLDLDLLKDIAERLPNWQFVLLGPVVKIDPATLPQGPNLHYLGMKSYHELPAYFSNWDAALMPFAINEATRYISPTKTPEYLAAGLPVVSTSIRDVARTYGGWDQVLIADSASVIEKALGQMIQYASTSDRTALDAFLQEQSWDNTWRQMQKLLEGQLVYAAIK